MSSKENLPSTEFNHKVGQHKEEEPHQYVFIEAEYKKLTTKQKLLLSTPHVVGLGWFYLLIAYDFYDWLQKQETFYAIAGESVPGIIMLTQLILIDRLWKLQPIPKYRRVLWTVLIILFSYITTLYYIWKVDDRLLDEIDDMLMGTNRNRS